MTTTTTTLDAGALAWIGAARVASFRDALQRARVALRRGMPRSVLYATLAPNFDAKAPAVAKARAWADADAPGTFVLAGPVGPGKTIGAAIWALRTGARWAQAAELEIKCLGL